MLCRIGTIGYDGGQVYRSVCWRGVLFAKVSEKSESYAYVRSPYTYENSVKSWYVTSSWHVASQEPLQDEPENWCMQCLLWLRSNFPTTMSQVRWGAWDRIAWDIHAIKDTVAYLHALEAYKKETVLT